MALGFLYGAGGGGSSIPEGATVTPVGDAYTWQRCANISNPQYTTIAEILADTTTLAHCIGSANATNYLVRSTSFASEMCADSNAMSYIGANDYCANTLLSNSTWRAAICNSADFYDVLVDKVPEMTSATTPSGEAFGDANVYYPAWQAFDSNHTEGWVSAGNGTNSAFCAYDFVDSMKVYKVVVVNRTESPGTRAIATFKIQGSNDKSTWVDVDSTTFSNVSTATLTSRYNITPNDAYRYIRLFVTSVYDTSFVGCATLQFYGRKDV